MSLFLHQIPAGFEFPHQNHTWGFYNKNTFRPDQVGQYRDVFVGDTYVKRGYGASREVGEQFFVSNQETEPVRDGQGRAVGSCRTVGRVTPTMIAGYDDAGPRGSFSGYSSIVISPKAWEQLLSGELEKLLPRRMRERNAGNKNLSEALCDPKAQEWVEGKEDRWKKREFRLDENEMFCLSFTTFRFQNKWEWDGTDRPVHQMDWVVALDRKGHLWCRLFKEGEMLAQWSPNYSGCPHPDSDYFSQQNWLREETKQRGKEWTDCFNKSVWVREDDPRFWVKTVGRGEAEK